MKLSIITINYNDATGLIKTIESVLAQTWKDFEWIVVDGGSTDGSQDVIEQYKDNFSFWCSEPDKGIYNALNKGISHAKGEYVSCMNAGDCFYEQATLSKVFGKEHHEDILYGDWIQVYPNEEFVLHEPYPIDFHAFLHQNICHQAMFVKTVKLKEKGFDESFKLLADYARWTELFLQGASVAYTQNIICKYDMRGASSTNAILCKKEYKRIIDEYVPLCILPMIEQLDYYQSRCAFYRLRLLLEKGGVLSISIRLILKIFDKCFLHFDFSTQNKFNFQRNNI